MRVQRLLPRCPAAPSAVADRHDLCRSAQAICVAQPSDGGFELQGSSWAIAPWIAEGRAGIDRGLGYQFTGSNNAWARNTTGWNTVCQPVLLTTGRFYWRTLMVRTSGNVTARYAGFRDGAQRPVAETRFGPLGGYQQLYIGVRPALSGFVETSTMRSLKLRDWPE